jgi:hypothetical protein
MKIEITMKVGPEPYDVRVMKNTRTLMLIETAIRLP